MSSLIKSFLPPRFASTKDSPNVNPSYCAPGAVRSMSYNEIHATVAPVNAYISKPVLYYSYVATVQKQYKMLYYGRDGGIDGAIARLRSTTRCGSEDGRSALWITRRRNVNEHLWIDTGWQNGMRLLVIFTALVPAMTAVAKSGPFLLV